MLHVRKSQISKSVLVGRTELTEEEMAKLYREKGYIVTYSKVYQLCYSVNTGYYGSMVYDYPVENNIGLVSRGRFQAMTAAEVNHLLGFKLLNEN